jgi:general secretion pathway protein K
MPTRAPARRGAAERQSGVALVIVISVLLVVALLAMSFVSATHSARQIVANEGERARADALLTAGLNRAAIGLMDPDQDHRWSGDGVPHELTFESGIVSMTIVDENGKIDLNVAPEQLLRGLLEAVGVAGRDADAITVDILDARAAANAAAAAAAAPNPQSAATVPGQPNPPAAQLNPPAAQPGPPQANSRAFQNVAQLRQVADMSGQIYDELLPFVTVYSGQPTINPAAAPEAVLTAIPDLDRADVAAILSMRGNSRPSDGAAIIQKYFTASRWMNSLDGPIYAIRVVARTGDGAGATAEFIIWLGNKTYSVIDRRD